MNIVYFIIIGIPFILIIWYILIYNKLNRSSIKIDEALSGIDIALAKRYDVLTKMVAVVKSYTKYEQETLFEIVKLRNNMSIKEKIEANQMMDENFQKINMIAENYPELKSIENYKLLQRAIIDVEEHLQAARRLYNANVSLYNQLLVSFPTNLIAATKKRTKKDFFEADELEKKNIKMNL